MLIKQNERALDKLRRLSGDYGPCANNTKVLIGVSTLGSSSEIQVQKNTFELKIFITFNVP